MNRSLDEILDDIFDRFQQAGLITSHERLAREEVEDLDKFDVLITRRGMGADDEEQD